MWSAGLTILSLPIRVCFKMQGDAISSGFACISALISLDFAPLKFISPDGAMVLELPFGVKSICVGIASSCMIAMKYRMITFG